MEILRIKDKNKLIDYIKLNIINNNELFKEEIIKYISLNEELNILDEIENLIDYLNKIEKINVLKFIKEDKYKKESIYKNIIYNKIIENINLNDISYAEKIIIEIGKKKNKEIYELQKYLYKKILNRFDEIESFYIKKIIRKNFDQRIISEINSNNLIFNQANMSIFGISFETKDENFDINFIKQIIHNSNNAFKYFKFMEKNILNIVHMFQMPIINEKGESINSMLAEEITANLIYAKTFNYNTEKINLTDLNKLVYKLDEGYFSFLQSNINIYRFMKEKEIYLALKESIVFLESLLRFIVYKKGEKSIFEYKKNKLNEKLFFVKDFCNKYKISNKHFTEYEKYLNDNLIENEVINGMLLNELINYVYEIKMFDEETKNLLKYFLLNYDNSGLNLRNEIFHGLRNEIYIEESVIHSAFMYIYSVILFLLEKKEIMD